MVTSVVVDLLKEMRYGSDSSPIRKQRRKRVAVEPGRSVSAADIATTSIASTSKTSVVAKPKPKKKTVPIPSSSSDESNVTFEPDEGNDSPESFDSDDLPILSKCVQSQMMTKNSAARESDSEDIPFIQLKKNRPLPSSNIISDKAMKPILNDWVLVEYKRKSVSCHFVGRVIAVTTDPECPYTVDFLKNLTKQIVSSPPQNKTKMMFLEIK